MNIQLKKKISPFVSEFSDYEDDIVFETVLNAENSTANFSFTLVDDMLFEILESVNAQLSFSGDAIERVTLGNVNASIFIVDDDGKFIEGSDGYYNT